MSHYEYEPYGRKLYGLYLQAAREKYEMTLREAARCLDISHSHLARLEAGTVQPSEETVLRTADFIGLEEDALLGAAGLIRSEYGEAIAACPNAFISQFQLLVVLNTPTKLIDELDHYIAGQRKKLGFRCGTQRVKPQDAIEMYKALSRKFRNIANEMKKMIVESDGEEDGEMGD